MRRLLIVLLMVLALPARMAWADVMPIRMAAMSDATSRAPAETAMTYALAHCHDAVDEAAGGEASSNKAHHATDCAQCAVCHGLAFVPAVKVHDPVTSSAVLRAAAMQPFASVDLPAHHKPPIS